MLQVLRWTFVLVVLFDSMPVIAQEALEYRFSFGDKLALSPNGNRVTLTVTNTSGVDVECGIATLLDSTSPDVILSRVQFRPVEGSADCLGGNCTAIFSPPPWVAIWSSVGPYAPGESKTCEFDVEVALPFADEITLVGNAGPVDVTPPSLSIPGVSFLGALFLALCIGISVFLSADRMMRNKSLNATMSTE